VRLYTFAFTLKTLKNKIWSFLYIDSVDFLDLPTDKALKIQIHFRYFANSNSKRLYKVKTYTVAMFLVLTCHIFLCIGTLFFTYLSPKVTTNAKNTLFSGAQNTLIM